MVVCPNSQSCRLNDVARSEKTYIQNSNNQTNALSNISIEKIAAFAYKLTTH